MRVLITILSITLLTQWCTAQTMFYSSIEDISDPFTITRIGTFDFSTCATTLLYIDTTIASVGYGEWGDLAYCPDGNLYGLSHDGIYLIDIENQSHTKIIEPLPPIRRYDHGIVCTKDTVLIFGERDIASYDLNEQVLTYYGRLPAGMSIWSNMYWLDNKLMASANDDILVLDLNNLANTRVLCTFPFTGFHSITQVEISCDSVALFAYHISGDIYLVDTTDCSVKLYCTLPSGPEETFQGSSPAFMFMPPEPCRMTIDLDENDASLPGLDVKDTIYCTLPSHYIFSDVEMFSDKSWDSLVIWIESGPNGVFLDGPIPSFSTVSGQQSRKLHFYPASMSDFTGFEPYMNELILTGVIPNGISDLKIGFCGWADYLITDTAYAYITLIGRTTNAGHDDSISMCLSDPSFSLSTLLSSETTTGGVWIPSTSQPAVFNPAEDDPGAYMYLVDDPVCLADTAIFNIEVFDQPVFDLGQDASLCPGDIIHLGLNLSEVFFLWSDGSSLPVIDITEPQSIWVQITDLFGCIYADSMRVSFDEDCIRDELFIPNIFSPDGNGFNDEWIISQRPGIMSLEVMIFDRWGNMVFHQTDERIHWDGYLKSKKTAPPGVYTYMVIMRTFNGKELVRYGDLTLLR